MQDKRVSVSHFEFRCHFADGSRHWEKIQGHGGLVGASVTVDPASVDFPRVLRQLLVRARGELRRSFGELRVERSKSTAEPMDLQDVEVCLIDGVRAKLTNGAVRVLYVQVQPGNVERFFSEVTT